MGVIKNVLHEGPTVQQLPVVQKLILTSSFNPIQVMCGCLINMNNHDDVIKRKYFPRYWPFVRGIHRSPVNSLHKGQWRGALVFSLICVWINGWVNNHEDGDLRRYRAHYDVTVLYNGGPVYNLSSDTMLPSLHPTHTQVYVQHVQQGQTRWVEDVFFHPVQSMTTQFTIKLRWNATEKTISLCTYSWNLSTVFEILICLLMSQRKLTITKTFISAATSTDSIAVGTK